MESNKKSKKSLHKDIIFVEILPRISCVKSLCKLKCVSKSWCSFISSKDFAKTHLKKMVKNTAFNQHKLISITPTSSKRDHYVMKHLSISSCFSEQQQSVIDASELEFDYPMTNYRTEIVGCCNGLFCIDIDSNYFVLWNPSTKKSHKLPPVLDKYLWIYLDGFGYDETNDDYKVVVRLTVLPLHSRGCCSFDYVFRLYSLKTNSWKTIDDFHGHLPFEGQGVYVSGKLHWAVRGFVTDTSAEVGLRIVSFDLGTETAGWVSQPSSVNGEMLSTALGVVQGCLCVFCYTRNGSVDVWLMKEYGENESWCKVANVPDSLFSLLHISEEGEVLFSEESSLVIYNPETNSARTQQINNSSKLHQIGFYIESLVSPCPDE